MDARRLGPLASLALAATVLSGHVTDKTTGQPLPGVQVLLTAQGHKSAHAYTNAQGTYRIAKVARGTYLVTLSSDDVPTQTFTLRVGGKATQSADFVACSITLDYSCNTP
jgi:5-hydroxyisourate hydrolase-like protein (transthyretin family)